MYPSFWQILIFLSIAIVLFGHKRIREFGKSLGEGLRDFKKGLEDNDLKDNLEKPNLENSHKDKANLNKDNLEKPKPQS